MRAFDQAVSDRHGEPAGKVIVAGTGVTERRVARADDDRLSRTVAGSLRARPRRP